MTISIITINYQSQQYLETFLRSLAQFLLNNPKNQHQIEVLVVNNEENSLTLDFPLPFEPRIINHNQNIGYGAANNLAAKQSQSEWLFFLNPDTQLKDDSLLKMFDYAQSSSKATALGPKIILANQNRPQPWTSGKKAGLCDLLFRNTINKPWNKKIITPVDWVSGTALLVKKSAFDQIGGFDEKFFMYFEDQDLCLRLKQPGKKILFFPDSQIIHFDGKSWLNFKDKKTSFYASQSYFFLKHHGKIKTFFLKALRLPLIFWQNA